MYGAVYVLCMCYVYMCCMCGAVPRRDALSDRFLCALYRKLHDPALLHAARLPWLLNLLHRTLRKDPSHRRVQVCTP